MRPERFLFVSPELVSQLQEMERSDPVSESAGVLLAWPRSRRLEAALPAPGPRWMDRFALSPGWLLQTLAEQRRRGFEIAGFFHCHPAGAGGSLRPSCWDRQGHPPGSLIVVFGAGAWRGFRVEPERCWEVPLSVG